MTKYHATRATRRIIPNYKLKMYIALVILCAVYSTGESANYQRYDDTTDRFPSSNLYNQYVQKNVNFGDELADGTKYPSHNVESSTSRYDLVHSSANGNPFYPAGYTSPRYAAGYGQGYGPGYGEGYGQSYGQNYGQGYGQGFSSYELPFVKNNGDYCINRMPQTGIWVDRLMGIWYGVELVQHLAGDSRVDYGRTCIVVHISEPKDRLPVNKQLHHVEALNARFRQKYRRLRLLWDEEGQTLEYALYFTNDSAGYWQAFDQQNGTMTQSQRGTYQQFTGTVQVLKAVHDHLVLNFCQEALAGRGAELYTVLFSREPRSMTHWDVDAVHSLLQNKNLSVASRRMVCGNGAEKLPYSLLLSFFTCSFAYMVCSS